MKVLFKKENVKSTISTILYFIFGILFCLMPVKMYNFVETILCTLLLGVGIVCVLVYSLMSHDDKPFRLLLYGIISTVLGLLMLMWHRLFGVILSVIIGYSGVLLIIEFYKNKKHGEKTNVAELAIGIVVTILSITAIVLSGTNASKNLLSIFFGVICLTQVIYNIILMIKILKTEKIMASEKTQKEEEKTEKIIENQEK